MKVNRISTAVLLLCCCVPLYAQQSEPSSLHFPRVGDYLKKQQVSYKELGRSGSNVLWDMSDVEIIEDDYHLSYVSGDTLGTSVMAVDNGSLYRYIPVSDSLWFEGFENHTSKTRYDRPECFLVEPLTYGVPHSGFLHGYSVDCEKVFMRSYGLWYMEPDATGMLILPGGDTLRHVTRVHSEKVLSGEKFPFIHSEEKLRQYVDSITPYTNDSILYHLRNDSSLIGIVNNRWYAEGYRYPIFETIQSGIINDTYQNVVAYYYAPEDQKNLIDIENESYRDILKDAEQNALYGDDSQWHDDDSSNKHTDELQFAYNAYYQEGCVFVEYYNSSPAEITCGIYTHTGLVISEQHKVTQDNGTHAVQFNISGQHPGIYILAIKVNDKTYTEKINKE